MISEIEANLGRTKSWGFLQYSIIADEKILIMKMMSQIVTDLGKPSDEHSTFNILSEF